MPRNFSKLIKACSANGLPRRFRIQCSQFAVVSNNTSVTVSSQRRGISIQKLFNLEHNSFSASYVFIYLLGGFIFAMLYISVYAVKDLNAEAAKNNVSPEERNRLEKLRDPRRPPWPVLHQKAVQMREGKLSHEDIAMLWEHTRHYYAHDWLIPLELAQILKFTSGVYLSAHVADPDGFRKEIIQQLEDVKFNRVPNPTENRVGKDVQEIIAIAIEELQQISLETTSEAPLVPVMSKKASSSK